MKMSTRFVSVLRQAFKTFNRCNKSFATNLALLKELTEQLTIHDFYFTQQDFLNDGVFQKKPCLYVHIIENDVLSMGVFVLRSGYSIPLHDHPLMHGILRGIYGKLNIQSYTQHYLPGEIPTYDRNKMKIPVYAEEPRTVGPDTECVILTPHKGNFHEITAVDNVAAFFDILSPPYDADIPIHGSRMCNFYRLESKALTRQAVGSQSVSINPNTASALQLVRIPVPQWYCCDNVSPPEQLIKSLQSNMVN